MREETLDIEVRKISGKKKVIIIMSTTGGSSNNDDDNMTVCVSIY